MLVTSPYRARGWFVSCRNLRSFNTRGTYATPYHFHCGPESLTACYITTYVISMRSLFAGCNMTVRFGIDLRQALFTPPYTQNIFLQMRCTCIHTWTSSRGGVCYRIVMASLRLCFKPLKHPGFVVGLDSPVRFCRFFREKLEVRMR